MSDLHQLLRRHQDRIEIEALKFAFCRASDELDIDGMVAGFTEHCVASYDVGEEILGRDALRAWYHGEVDITIASNHYITNFELVFVSDDEASSRCLLHSWKRFVGYPQRPDRLRWARYVETWQRTPDGWRQTGLVYRVQGEANGSDPERAGELSPRWPPVAHLT